MCNLYLIHAPKRMEYSCYSQRSKGNEHAMLENCQQKKKKLSPNEKRPAGLKGANTETARSMIELVCRRRRALCLVVAAGHCPTCSISL
jgi:hypothetical protein